jgi:4'-phosphopantetheinyl transferase
MPGSVSWQPSPSDLHVSDQTVDVWLADLDQPAQPLLSLLAAAERQRADEFRFPHLKSRYVAAHGILRILIARYLNRQPEELVIALAEHGKPYLPGAELQFNLSHSENWAVYAFARRFPVGVDIEAVRDLDDLYSIARHYFSPAERAALAALPTAQQTQGFFNAWTRKEAFIKGIGKGLSQPLDSFTVTLEPDQPAELLHVADLPEAPQRWSMNALPTPPGFAGALAVYGQGYTLRLWSFNHR